MRWNQGRDIIDRMLADNELQRVPASREHADRLISQARRHLVSADEISNDDPAGGYTLVYDAARKALTAVYVVCAGAETVTPIATATNTPGKPIRVGGLPMSIAFAPGPARN